MPNRSLPLPLMPPHARAKLKAEKPKKYIVGGRGKALPLEEAEAKRVRFFNRTGIIVAVEEASLVRQRNKAC